MKKPVLQFDDNSIGQAMHPVGQHNAPAASWLSHYPDTLMPIYRLHYFPESGNSYKLALMLTLCGQSFEPVWTDFGAGITRTAEWRRTVNVMGEIPVLEQDGERMTQTAPILLRLAETYRQFLGNTERERFEVLRWLFWDNQKLSAVMAEYRYRRAFTPSPNQAVLAHLKTRLDDFLGILERHVANHAFIAAAHPTVADLSMQGYLCFPAAESGYDLAGSHPAIAAWLGRVAAVPGWAAPYDLLPGKRLRMFA